MGYTHYFTRKNPLTNPQMDALQQEKEKMLSLLAKGCRVVPEEDWLNFYQYDEEPTTNRVLAFNGDPGCETLIIDQVPVHEFNFCKTRLRPYDTMVTAMLIALKRIDPETRVSSDG